MARSQRDHLENGGNDGTFVLLPLRQASVVTAAYTESREAMRYLLDAESRLLLLARTLPQPIPWQLEQAAGKITEAKQAMWGWLGELATEAAIAASLKDV